MPRAYSSPTKAGALNRMGVRVSDDEATAIVEHYDLDDTGEMEYEVCTGRGYHTRSRVQTTITLYF